MLEGISPLISPKLLAVLSHMGHGDEIVLADAHFPGITYGKRVLRADGISVSSMLDAILPLFALDSYVEYPVVMMSVIEGDAFDPSLEAAYQAVIDKHRSGTPPIKRIDRFEFYQRTKSAFAVVLTGETAKYGNVLLKKGVTPIEPHISNN